MRQAPASATSASAAAPHRISRRLANARSARRRRFSESAGEILPERAERRRAGMSWSEAGRYVKQVTVKQTTPTTAKSPRSQMAVMRFTMSEPNPITVVTAEIVSGSQTRAKARTTISSGGAPAATCS